MIFLVGIPNVYFEPVRLAIAKALPGEHVTGLPLIGKSGSIYIEPDYFDNSISTIRRYVDGRPNSISNGLAIISVYCEYIKSSVDASSYSSFSFSMNYNFAGNPFAGPSQVAKDKNLMARDLINLAKRAVKNRNVVSSYLQSKRNRTPLLLPLRHFNEPELVEAVKHAAGALSKPTFAIGDLDNICRDFEKSFPYRKDGHPAHFQNSKGVHFHSPGRALHGRLRSDAGGHLELCHLTDKLRIGGVVQEGFHYDCAAGTGNYSGTFENCHDETVHRSGKPHLNVYPNDHIR